MKTSRFQEIAAQVDSLLVHGDASGLDRAQPLLRELTDWARSLNPAQRGGFQAELKSHAVLWERLLEGAHSFVSGWSRASTSLPETYTAEGGLRTALSLGRLRVDA